jgi:hypothetical protein
VPDAPLQLPSRRRHKLPRLHSLPHRQVEHRCSLSRAALAQRVPASPCRARHHARGALRLRRPEAPRPQRLLATRSALCPST